MSEPSQTPFAIVMRGYDRNQVEARLGQLERSLREARARVEDLDARSLQLAERLSETHRQLREGQRPSFTGVGARIEQLLTLAEEQAAAMVAEATAEAADVRADAQAVLGEARAGADREVQEVRETARREAEEMLSRAREESQQRRSDLAAELDRTRADAEQDIAQRHQGGMEQAEAALIEAEARAATAMAWAAQAEQVGERSRRAAEEEAATLLLEARRSSEELLARAQTRADGLVEQARTRAEQETADARRDLQELTRQREAVNGHLTQLRELLGVSTGPAALDGPGQRGALPGGPASVDVREGREQDAADVVDGELEEHEAADAARRGAGTAPRG